MDFVEDEDNGRNDQLRRNSQATWRGDCWNLGVRNPGWYPGLGTDLHSPTIDSSTPIGRFRSHRYRRPVIEPPRCHPTQQREQSGRIEGKRQRMEWSDGVKRRCTFLSLEKTRIQRRPDTRHE